MNSWSSTDLSVIILNWNTQDLLRDCLDSVFAEPTGLRLEVFVVDNASSDGSPEMVRLAFPAAKLIENDENVGFAVANNRTFPLCSADKILLLNSDTVVLGDALRVLVNFMDQHRQAGIIGPKLTHPHARLDVLGCGGQMSLRTTINHSLFLSRFFPRIFEGTFHYCGVHDDVARRVGWVSGACMLVRRQAIDSVGPMSEQWFMYCEDQEWCARMLRNDWEVWHVPDAVVEHRLHASSDKNPDVFLMPTTTGRELFIKLNQPSRFALLVYDVVSALGFILRAIGYFVRSIVSGSGLRPLWRGKSEVSLRLCESPGKGSNWSFGKINFGDVCSSQIGNHRSFRLAARRDDWQQVGRRRLVVGSCDRRRSTHPRCLQAFLQSASD